MGNEKMNEPFLLQGDSGKKSKEQLMKDLFLTLEKHPKAYEAADIVHLRQPHPIQVTPYFVGTELIKNETKARKDLSAIGLQTQMGMYLSFQQMEELFPGSAKKIMKLTREQFTKEYQKKQQKNLSSQVNFKMAKQKKTDEVQQTTPQQQPKATAEKSSATEVKDDAVKKANDKIVAITGSNFKSKLSDENGQPLKAQTKDNREIEVVSISVKEDKARVTVNDEGKQKTVGLGFFAQTAFLEAAVTRATQLAAEKKETPKIEIGPKTRIEAEVVQNQHAKGVYDIRITIDGEKLPGHHLSKEDRDAVKEGKAPLRDLVNKYFQEELGGQQVKFVHHPKLTEDVLNDKSLKIGGEYEKANFYVNKETNKTELYARVENWNYKGKEVSKGDVERAKDQSLSMAYLVNKYYGEEIQAKRGERKDFARQNEWTKHELPKEFDGKVNLWKRKDGEYAVTAYDKDKNKIGTHKLDAHERYSFFHDKTATKEQIAAKNLSNEIKAHYAPKNEESQSMKR